MAGEPDNLMLMLLRRIDERTERMAQDIQDLKVRMTAVLDSFAGVNSRIDRLDGRVERVERRLSDA